MSPQRCARGGVSLCVVWCVVLTVHDECVVDGEADDLIDAGRLDALEVLEERRQMRVRAAGRELTQHNTAQRTGRTEATCELGCAAACRVAACELCVRWVASGR